MRKSTFDWKIRPLVPAEQDPLQSGICLRIPSGNLVIKDDADMLWEHSEELITTSKSSSQQVRAHNNNRKSNNN